MFVILIGVYTQQEYNIDKMQSKADRIYALGGTIKGEPKAFEASHHDIQAKLLSRYPEIESTCAVSRAELYLNMPYGSKLKVKTLFVDSTFYKLFDFELVEGNRNTVLNEKNSAVVTEECAKKIFGNVDPIGQTITYNDSIHLVVTGVAKKMENSCLCDNDMLIRFENAKNYNPSLLGSKMGNALGASVFILAKPNTYLMSKTKDMTNYVKTFFWFYKIPDCGDRVLLFPFNKLYFSNTDSCTGVTDRGDLKLVNILFTVGMVILLFAIMNYINLTVAQSGISCSRNGNQKIAGQSTQRDHHPIDI
jgi:putative ABC transport system permease protein